MKTFIEKAKLKHGVKYDYRNVNYINAKTKVKILCTSHGEFLQAPTDHLSGVGCPKCGRERQAISQSKTTESFIKKALIIHGNCYNYSKVNYINNSTKIIITCSVHGDFNQTPSHHLNRKQGCPKCKANNTSQRCTLTQEYFLMKANLKHKNFYNYEESEYKNSFTKIKIKCPLHGLFFQTPGSHLSGAGCKFCALDEHGWTTKEKFKKRCGSEKGTLYLIRCFNDDEEFYKVGITSKSIKQRFKSKYHMPYNYVVIQEIKDFPEIIWELEKYINKLLKNFNCHYIPTIKFGGHLSECFLLPQNLKNLSSQLL